MDKLLEIENLTKRFGPITAVDHVTFSVRRGEVLGFLGPNGAGKSTTMKMVTGYFPPTEGTARVCGFDIVRDTIAAQRRLGYLPEGAPAYGDMTPAGLLDFVADIRRLSGARRRTQIATVVERLQLASVLPRPIETLSKGFKRRVGLAQAILLDPEVLILDEPTDGLDPNQKHEVRALLKDMAGEKAIVISTHILEEVEAVCSRAIIIARGRIVADADPESLKARSAYHNAVALRVPRAQAEDAVAALRQLPAVARVETVDEPGEGTRVVALPAGDQEIFGAVGAAIGELGIRAEELVRERGRLDDVFRDLTAAA